MLLSLKADHLPYTQLNCVNGLFKLMQHMLIYTLQKKHLVASKGRLTFTNI